MVKIMTKYLIEYTRIDIRSGSCDITLLNEDEKTICQEDNYNITLNTGLSEKSLKTLVQAGFDAKNVNEQIIEDVKINEHLNLKYIDVDPKSFNQKKLDGKNIRFKGSIIGVREFNGIMSINISCKDCEENITLKNKAYHKMDIKVCPNCQMNAQLIPEYVSGLELQVVPIGEMCTAQTRRFFCFISIENLTKQTGTLEKSPEDRALQLLKTFGLSIGIEGEYHLDIERTKSGRIVGQSLRINVDCLRDVLKEKTTLSTDDIEKIRITINGLEQKTIERLVAPSTFGHGLLKQIILLNNATPIKIKNRVLNGRIGIFGDPGVSKSAINREFLTQIAELSPVKVSAESASVVGLGGTVIKSPDGNGYVIEWGVFPYANKKNIVIDGWHALKPEHVARLREMQEVGEVEIWKAAKGRAECLTRITIISNANQSPIRNYYPTKFHASFDLGTGTEESERGAFKGADRRRCWLFYVCSAYDENETQVIEKNILADFADGKKRDSCETDAQLTKLIGYIWDRTEEDYNVEVLKFLNPRIAEILREWRRTYGRADWALFTVQGTQIFLSYLYARAALTLRFDADGKIYPDVEDVEFVKELFESLFKELELSKYLQSETQDTEVAKRIAEALHTTISNSWNNFPKNWDKVRKFILARGKNPLITREELCQKLGYDSVKSLWNIANDAGRLSVTFGEHTLSYSVSEGAAGLLEPLYSRGYDLTGLGNAVYLELEKLMKGFDKYK